MGRSRDLLRRGSFCVLPVNSRFLPTGSTVDSVGLRELGRVRSAAQYGLR